MNNRTKKIINLCLAIFLAFLFIIVTPNHHHEDNADHCDCVVCLIMHLHYQAAVTFSLIIATRIAFTKLVFYTSKEIVSQATESFLPRAPPLNTCC